MPTPNTALRQWGSIHFATGWWGHQPWNGNLRLIPAPNTQCSLAPNGLGTNQAQEV